MEQSRIARAGETGDPTEKTPISGIVRHDFQVRKSRGDPAGNQNRYAMMGGDGRRQGLRKLEPPEKTG
ncbi:hypothetical protein PR048_019059 [Dryococelus australis]|uniref:Uncharacterized protein n=1 Tax=Dryococelus australis TaxID=614101 RepID=A0ABQ9H2S9_9NEOP|nr:hypothetical protein PR048_019059 [Dryococelus australis]